MPKVALAVCKVKYCDELLFALAIGRGSQTMKAKLSNLPSDN
jgi:hypothetical protein